MPRSIDSDSAPSSASGISPRPLNPPALAIDQAPGAQATLARPAMAVFSGRSSGSLVAGGVLAGVLAACAASCAAMWFGYQLGSEQANGEPPLPQLHAASSAIGETMAMATGPVTDDADGVFFLDFNTGDLQCMVYYPRAGGFGAHYYANVLPALGGGGKNSKYLLATGRAAVKASSGGKRPGSSLVYVTDVTNGTFAAYAVPWDGTAEASGRGQSGPLVVVGGGSVRNYRLPDANQQPGGIVAPNKK